MGLCQGDPMSGMLQAIGMQPDLVELDMECLQGGGGVARAGSDDVFALGPPEVALPTMAMFGGRLKERCDLDFQWDKTVVYGEEMMELPPYAMPGIRLAGEEVGGSLPRALWSMGRPWAPGPT